MKIRLSELRRIIRETINQQAWVPGRWMPSDGESIDHEDLDKLGDDGFGDFYDEDEDQ